MKSILIATHNKAKVHEISQVLSPLDYCVETASDHNLPEPDETGRTLIDNARLKAHAGAQAAGVPALADDSGFELPTLEGLPGVYTADWAVGDDGQRSDVLSMQRIYDAAAAMGVDLSEGNTPACYRCTMVMAWPDGREAVFSGVCEGKVVWPPRGSNGFGQDAMFLPKGCKQTFGEMPLSEKLNISHRTLALENMQSALSSSDQLTLTWKRLSTRTKNILEWVESMRSGRHNTLGLTLNEPLTINGGVSPHSGHDAITSEDLSEIAYFYCRGDAGDFKMKLEGATMLISVAQDFEGDISLKARGYAYIMDQVLSPKWVCGYGENSWDSKWAELLNADSIEKLKF